MGKLKIELNDTQNIRDLLQEAYRLADEQIVQAQNEINLSYQSRLNDLNRYNQYATAKMQNQLQAELTDLNVEDENQHQIAPHQAASAIQTCRHLRYRNYRSSGRTSILRYSVVHIPLLRISGKE